MPPYTSSIATKYLEEITTPSKQNISRNMKLVNVVSTSNPTTATTAYLSLTSSPKNSIAATKSYLSVVLEHTIEMV